MLARVLDFPYSLWLIAFALYAIDCLRLIPPGALLLAERTGRRFVPVLSAIPFELRGREAYAPELIAPWRGVFVGHWGDVDNTAPSISPRRLDAVRMRLLPLRGASAANFALMFVVGPVLTWRFGLPMAVLLVAPLVYLINVLAAVYAYRRRRVLQLSTRRALWLAADALLCAPYGANWVKRVTRAAPMVRGQRDGLWQLIASAHRERLERAIATRLADSVPEDSAR